MLQSNKNIRLSKERGTATKMYMQLIKERELNNWNNNAPFYVYISLNNSCNANCIFCDVHRSNFKYNQMPIYKLIDELSDIGAQYIHFMGGGEPFVDPHIMNYMEYITEKDMNIVCTTNAFALNHKKIDRIVKYNLKHIFISIDGSRSEIHDRIRGVKGIFDNAVDVINYLKEKKKDIDIVVNHVVNKNNIDFFEEMLDLGKRVNFDYLNLILVKDNPELEVTEEQKKCYISKIPKLMVMAIQNDIKFFVEDINIFQTTFPINSFACFFPYYAAYIDCTTGDVYPCDCTIHRSNEYCYGNLFKDTFKDIWNGEKLTELRNGLIETQMSCKENCDIVNILSNKCLGRNFRTNV